MGFFVTEKKDAAGNVTKVTNYFGIVGVSLFLIFLIFAFYVTFIMKQKEI